MPTSNSSPRRSDTLDTDALLDYLHTAPVRLAVFGEFSAGKTTVLNALIGEEILSVAVDPTTAVPTRIRFGREFNIFIDRTGGEQLVLFEDDPPFWTRFVGRRDTLNTLQKQKGTIQDFLRMWTKEGERANEVERVIIEIPLDWLKQGIELVDTPGVNNEFTRHQGFTEQEARTADIALLLMDARQGGGKRTEFEFMNEVQKQVQRCIVAPNKMDLVEADEREEFIEYIQDIALPQHWDGAVVPPVIGISALASLHPQAHDEPDLQAAFEDLTTRLEHMAEEERGKLLLSRKDNPEKALFAEARTLEGNNRYDRAHRIYFDLLDILEAAGLDPTPAEEGIRRCETHLSSQVDTLDELNAQYNAAMARAEDDPDAALEQLKAIRAEKSGLALDDGDLDASIEALAARIDRRDEARAEISRLCTQVEQHRDNEAWIDAAKISEKLPTLIEPAELSAKKAESVRSYVAKQKDERDAWATREWKEVKADIEACLEADRYIDAEQHLAALQYVAPYTPFGDKTDALVQTVTEQADTERAYRKAVQDATAAAGDLTKKRISPERGQEIAEQIDAILPLYRSLYGKQTLLESPEITATAPALTINQKLALATRLHALGAYASARRSEAILEAVQERKAAVDAIHVDDAGRVPPDLAQQHPDHPAVEETIHHLMEADISFWTPFWRIHAIHDALDSFSDHIEDGLLDARGAHLANRKAMSVVFYAGTVPSAIGLILAPFEPLAIALVLLGIAIYSLNGLDIKHAWSAKRHIERGDRAREQGNLAEAANHYHQSIALDKQAKTWQELTDLDSLIYAGVHSFRNRTGYTDEYCLNTLAASPYIQWRYETEDKVRSSPAVAGGTVFVGSDDGSVYALEARTGELQWRYETGSWVRSSPAVAGETMFVGCNDGSVYALEALTGELRWRYETEDSVFSSPAVAGGTVFVGCNDGSVYALEALTGELQWRYETEDSVFSSPAVAGGTVFVGSDDGSVYALEARTGELQWRYETGSWVRSSPAVAGETMFVGCNDGSVYALEALTGELRWRYETEDSVFSSPAVAGGTVFVGCNDGSVYALEALTGELQWRYETGSWVRSSPAVAGGTVFVGSDDGSVYALEAPTGELQWRYEIGSWVFSSPAVAGGTVFVECNDGSVYALGGP
ncbi:beta-alanine-activating enzyme beta-propeller domain-containing protein [Salisaeta longa]|uniref:beta-alanine-activating enzyme beta-propeller domain-containing protein n=1 Tax=Salisaeta longa TaxID=503170 RepID=UPI0003B32839|nr:PQQ-binding-like beta-propeller repeat protein [Salisaeta longa]